MMLTLAQARTILDKTLAAAREKKFKPLGVAVVDSRGALRAYAEEDGNPILRSKIASGKAFGSVAFGTGSRRLHQIGVERPHMAAALVEMTGGTLVPVPGGVLIRDKAGALLGAVGVSGRYLRQRRGGGDRRYRGRRLRRRDRRIARAFAANYGGPACCIDGACCARSNTSFGCTMCTERPVMKSTKPSTTSRNKVGVAACGTNTSSPAMTTNRMNESRWSMTPLPPGRTALRTST